MYWKVSAAVGAPSVVTMIAAGDTWGIAVTILFSGDAAESTACWTKTRSVAKIPVTEIVVVVLGSGDAATVCRPAAKTE